MTEISFLPGVPVEHVLGRLAAAGGNEIESGKLLSAESSAALAINCFGWFIDRPGLLPPFPGLEVGYPVQKVEVEFQARFPWSGGKHPWLDAVAFSGSHLIGIESKRFEPFRDQKTVSLSEAYDRPVWGDHMRPFEMLRDALRSGEEAFKFLDVAQLTKHAFGLVTAAQKQRKNPVLLHIFSEPERRGTAVISPTDLEVHRAEIRRFSSLVAGAEVAFASISYREWIAGWPMAYGVAEHGQRLIKAFSP